MTKTRLLACIVLFSAVMLGAKYAITGAVNSYGYISILAMFAVVYAGARWDDHRAGVR